jgi:hypothetical protein
MGYNNSDSMENKFKIGDKVNIPFLNRRENGMIRRIKDDKALVVVVLPNVKGKYPQIKELWVSLNEIELK